MAECLWHLRPTGNNSERMGPMVSQGTESHEATGRRVSSSSPTGIIKIKRRWTEMGMWYTLVIPALRKLRQENYKFKASLEYRVTLSKEEREEEEEKEGRRQERRGECVHVGREKKCRNTEK